MCISLLASLYFMLPLVPADNINPQFIAALSWLHTNTSPNATILTLWPDGSVVEGYAQRQSYTDSMMSLNPTAAAAFEHFLYAKEGNYTYLLDVHPSYLLVRRTWLEESIGMLLEAGLPLNTSYQGTNLQQFLQLNDTAPPPFPVVYRNNNTIIYAINAD